MKDVSLAARYARALFLVTEKRSETVQALGDVMGLVPVLGPQGRIGAFLASPQVRLADKREVLRKGLHGRVLPIVVVFVELLLRKRRLRDFDTVVSEFEALVERAQGIQRAHVVSAVTLEGPERDRLLRELERRTGSRIRLTSEVDPALLGGALVRIGDRVVDRSVSTLLETVEKQLLEVSV